MSERIRGSYDDALYKSTYIYFTLLNILVKISFINCCVDMVHLKCTFLVHPVCRTHVIPMTTVFFTHTGGSRCSRVFASVCLCVCQFFRTMS